MKNIYKVLLVLLFVLMGSCTNGDSDTGNQNAPKPPVDDPDKIKYSENLLDFSSVSLKQYLVQSKDNQPHGENSFDIFLNQGSAKGLEPEKYLKISYDVNMTVELDNKDVTNTILSNPVCKLTYSGDHSCKIIFKPIKDIGVYKLKFSYKGIDINKQILLYVATRSGLFVDNKKDEVHIVGGNYQVDLQLKSNLANEDLIVPLTYTENTVCITKIGDINASDQGTECIQYPRCEYQPQIGDLPRVCSIHYTLLKGGNNHPRIEVNQNSNYLRRLEIPSVYEPFTCLKDGLELMINKSDKTPINSIFLHTDKQEKKEFTAFYCVSDNTSQASVELSLNLNEIEPNNIVGKDAFEFFSGDQGESVFPIGSAINIHNGEYKTIQVQYNQAHIKELKYFGSARAVFTVTNEGKERGNNSIVLENPDRITFLRVGTEESEIDKPDINKDISSITVKSHDQYNYREVFMKPDNLKYQGNSTLIMNTCFIEPESGIFNKKYDENDSNCLIGYDYLDAKAVKQTVTLDDANITVGYYPAGRVGADLIKLPRGFIPSVVKDDLLQLKNGQHFVLHIDATEVYPSLNAKVNVSFYEQNIYTLEKVHFMQGDLRVDLEGQSYLVAPNNKRLLSFLAPKTQGVDKFDSRYIDKFYIRAIQSPDAQFKSHKIRFAILDKSAPDITIKGYHMVAQEKYDENNRPVTMADNRTNECVLAEKGASAGKYCECTVPDTGGDIIDDAKACNFEIVSYGQSDGDYVNIGLVDQKNRSMSGEKIMIKYKYAGEDIKFRVRNPDLFGVSDGRDIKNSVYFPMDKITQVKKDDSNQWDENIFKPDAFFNSSMNMFADNNNMIHIINFPGKANIVDNDSDNNIPEFYLWTNSACFNHNGTACSNKYDTADNMVCTIPSGAITFSNNDVVQNKSVLSGTVLNTNNCSYGKLYHLNEPKHLPVLQTVKEGMNAKCDSNSSLFHYMKDVHYSVCTNTVRDDRGVNCEQWSDLYTMITAKYRLNIHCQLSSSNHESASDVYDFALSQRTNIATDDNNPRNANSGICFGVKQQFLDDGNKGGDPDIICDGLGLK
jgi:hypothetical protein